MRSSLLTLASLFLLLPPAQSQQSTDPALGSWRRNLDGNTGKSTDPTIDSVVSHIQADVQGVLFTGGHAYVEASGLPAHFVGPWTGNPGVPGDQEAVYRIPRSPVEETGPKTATPLGTMGVLVNGVAIFNTQDAASWHDMGIWNQNAIYWEGSTMDTGFGHPAGDLYHYHQSPTLLVQSEGENGTDHSPILGFAFDGFPIYGAYAFAGTDGGGGVVRMEPSYRLRNIGLRNSLPDGTMLPPPQWGPDVSSDYPLGAYIEDYEYVAGLGHLDEHNGRTCVTPEYPGGTYAYFAVLDESGVAVYPYFLGPTYYGVVDTENLTSGSPQVSVPASATDYAPFSLYEHDIELGSLGTLALGDADPGAMLFFAYTFVGLGPTTTAFGDLGMSPPFLLLGPFFANGQGSMSLSVGIPAPLAGLTVYSQAVTASAGQVVLSNSERVYLQ